ncbi:MAG: NADP-dependent isocitrate dehydrogenase, partial [Proteobacteria bacterium]
MEGTLVNGPGDEMTGVIWSWIIEELLDPHVRLNLETYDLSLPSRERTGDAVTRNFAEAILRHRVGVKCATITPNDDRVKEFGLTQKWKSPNATIRAILDGVIVRRPIDGLGINPKVPAWGNTRLAVLRHGSGDIYGGQELRVDEPGRAEILFTPSGGGEPQRKILRDFAGPGVVMGMTNTDDSIRGFARACLRYGRAEGMCVWFAAKD